MVLTENNLDELVCPEMAEGQPPSRRLVIESEIRFGELLNLDYCVSVVKWAQKNIPDITESAAYQIGAVISEIGMNAARHGNKYRLGTAVDIQMLYVEGVVSAIVKDQGGPVADDVLEFILECKPLDPEEGVSALLTRLDTSQYEDFKYVTGEIKPQAELNGSGFGLSMVKRCESFIRLTAERYDKGLCVRVDLDPKKCI